MKQIPINLKTDNSLLKSLIKINDLINYAKTNNLNTLAIADNTMYGVMEFYNACKKENIKPVIGYEVDLEKYKIVLYAKTYKGYLNLIKISSLENKENLIRKYSEDLICIVPFEYKYKYNDLKNLFDNIYIGYSDLEQKREIQGESIYFKEVLYLEKEDNYYYKYLKAIKDNQIVDEVTNQNDNYFENNSELYNKNNELILDMINVEIKTNKDLLPLFPLSKDKDSSDVLKQLSKEGLKRIFGEKVNKIYIDRLKYELEIINKLNFSNYFLIVADYVNYAKNEGIMVGPGRGSAAGSLVSYCLNITTVDPVKHNLLFERFLNPSRINLPDIDVDFEDNKREKVINYCINKYGEKNVAGIITFGTLASKQVIRDLGKTLKIEDSSINYLAKMLDSRLNLKQNIEKNAKLKKYLMNDLKLKELYKVALKLEGLKKHTSIHAAGIVICNEELDNIVPIVKNKEGLYSTGYSMEFLEELGLLKMDFLGLKNLSIINETIMDLKKDNIDIDLDNLNMQDEKTYEIFKKANTIGIFQFESDGIKKLLKNLKPSNFEELSAAIALYRPGPMDNIDLYIKRKNNEQKTNYFHETLEPILKNTYGIILYQEQIMQIASIIAGYSLSEADILRRAVSKKNFKLLEGEKQKFIKKSIEKGYTQEISQEIFNLILKFASYGFNRSHAIAYATISYQMAYLKANYPQYFIKNLLNSSLGSIDKIKEYLYEAKINHVEVEKPNINLSYEHFILRNNKLVFPISKIKNININFAKEIIEQRNNGKYKDIFDFSRRLNLKMANINSLENLINASVFDDFKANKQTLNQNIDIILNYAEIATESTLKPSLTIYDEYDNNQLLKNEFAALGFYLTSNPIIDAKLKYRNFIEIKDIKKHFNKNVNVLVYVESKKEINTKNDEKMLFINAIDEIDKIDLVLFPKIYKNYINVNCGDVLIVNGEVEKRYDEYQIIVKSMKKVN